jgi:outer membrane protein assembly factor BamE (lipoprotein component of BamABCDE complex)
MFRTLLSFSIAGLLTTVIQINCSVAEEIRIPVGEQAKTQSAVDMPTKGMSKERVKSLFGEALEEVPAKGQPPISRWRYQEFTVYFDSNTVIHCVRNFQPKASATESSDSPAQ